MKHIGERALLGLLCLALVCLFPAVASAARAYPCGEDLTYTFDSATGTLTIEGSGEMANNGSLPYWFSRREEIKSVSLPEGLTSISDSAFTGCTKLTSITIPRHRHQHRSSGV